ncbi:MAG: UbiX family flavin prenyltransferase [Candidatus Diapherotrites archaeon]|nr:UbiX family flavin prenyltransferase [Candidatus Diapherotrites archaeon]
MRIIVGVTGSSGDNYALALLKALRKQKVEVHLIVSEWAGKVLELEAGKKITELKKLAYKIYSNENMAASISSSSFVVDGMIILPASIKTVSEILHAHTSTLISRCADNMLKTQNKLVIGIRETPLSGPTLENLWKLSVYGAIIFPLSPGFYGKPKKISDLEDFIIGKAMDLLGVINKEYKRWE